MAKRRNKKSDKLVFKASNLEEIVDLTKKSIELEKDKDKKGVFGIKSTSILNRESSSIAKWRRGLNQIQRHNPQFYDLIRLYREIELDSEVISGKNLRFNNTLSRSFVIKNKSGEIDEKLTEYFTKEWFRFWQEQTLESILFGYTLFKIEGIENDEVTGIESVKREFYNIHRKEVLEQYTSMEGQSILEGELSAWTFDATPYTKLNDWLGLYGKIAPYSIYLKEANQNLNDLLSRFGLPKPVVKSNLQDEESVRLLESYLQNLSNSSHCIIGENDEVEFLDGNAGSADAFTKSMLENKEAISKILLGTTTLNTDNSFVGSTEIGQSNLGALISDDIFFLESQFKTLRDKLVGLGLNFLEGCTLEINKTNPASLDEKKFLLDIVNTGKLKINSEFLSERLGFEVELIETKIEEDGQEIQKDNEDSTEQDPKED